MARHDLPVENILTTNNKTPENRMVASVCIIYYTMLSLKTTLLEVDIFFGVMSFACIAFEFSKKVYKTIEASQKTTTLENLPETVEHYQRILRLTTIYNEAHGLLVLAYIIDLLVFSSLSATNLSTLVTILYNGVVICLFITIYFVASFAAINVSLVFNLTLHIL